MDAPLHQTADLVADFLGGLTERPVGLTPDPVTLRAALGGPLPEGPTDAESVVTELAKAVDPGLVASAGPRYFGFVIGGSLPAALAADWLASGWDQNTGLYLAAPAATILEDVTAGWLLELLGLSPHATVGFVTGATMANFTGLAAARHDVLDRAGWDVERDGLNGAPAIRVVVGAERHTTVDLALRYLGLGSDRAEVAAADGQGRMRVDDLRRVLASGAGPTIVCAQAGNVNTGALDPMTEICAAAHDAGAWVHVDGAFGMWAAASPALRRLVAGIEAADSWATDAHKWLNVPYDGGLAIVAHPEAHRAAMSTTASYLIATDGQPDQMNFTPEASRRARGIPVYAAIRALGRTGVAELVERCCALARRFAAALGDQPDIEVLNDVVLNQVLVRFADSDEVTRDVVRRVQEDGSCWTGGTTWQGRGAMRISVSNWSTSDVDVDRSVAAIVAAANAT